MTAVINHRTDHNSKTPLLRLNGKSSTDPSHHMQHLILCDLNLMIQDVTKPLPIEFLHTRPHKTQIPVIQGLLLKTSLERNGCDDDPILTSVRPSSVLPSLWQDYHQRIVHEGNLEPVFSSTQAHACG